MKKQTITAVLDIQAKIDSVLASANTIQNTFNKLKVGDKMSQGIIEAVEKIEKEVNNLQELTASKEINPLNEKKIRASITKIDNLYESFFQKLEKSDFSGSFLKEDAKAISVLKKTQSDYADSVEETDKEYKKLISDAEKLAKANKKAAEGASAEKKKINIDTKSGKAEYNKRQAALSLAKDNKKKVEKDTDFSVKKQVFLERANKDYGGDLNDKNLQRTKEAKEYKAALAEVQKAEEQAQQAKAAADKSNFTNNAAIQNAKNLEKAYEDSAKAVEDLKNKQAQINGDNLKSFVDQLKSIKDIDWSSLGVDLESIDSVEKFEQAILQVESQALPKLQQELLKIKENGSDMGKAIKGAAEDINDGSEALDKLTDHERELDRLKQQVLDFFSIGNAVELFKRAVRSAFDTVKELDKTMTEAAVVTEFTVPDMWAQLPKYTKEASKLGTTINDLYGATTLYYQQGLKTNEAMTLGVETMKMARIADMGAEDATKHMTAALRGFNMELNETSSQRVNDVYSELAAITAADTNQIATAMSKTASIASAANMEFESTAAFLAQIIETTQEAPETAGTALKTIIARFSEVKKLREQGLGSGQDEEGEIIDVNKIQTALRTVGISMDDFFAGTEGLDSVLMKLASKWETLDFETQRYIATTAAGSRQQSRFIAMMSNYARTQELVGAANNSAGASQKQFEKTMDSLEAKTNQLKDAWQEFLMGLANSEVIKGAVTGLTGLLKAFNGVLKFASLGNGFNRMLLSILSTIMAFKGARKVLDNVLPKGLSFLMGKEKDSEQSKTDSSTKATMQKNSETGVFSGIRNALTKVKEHIKSVFKTSVSQGTEEGIVQAEQQQIKKKQLSSKSNEITKSDLSNKTKRAEFASANFGGSSKDYLEFEKAYRTNNNLSGQALNNEQIQEVMAQYEAKITAEKEKQLITEQKVTSEKDKQSAEAQGETAESKKQKENAQAETAETEKGKNNEKTKTAEGEKQVALEKEETAASKSGQKKGQLPSTNSSGVKNWFQQLKGGVAGNAQDIFKAGSFKQGAKNFGSKVKGAGAGNAMASAMVASAVIKGTTKIIDNAITTAGERIEQFGDSLEGVSSLIEKTRQALDNLASQRTEYNNFQKTIKRLDSGSKEYADSLRQNNAIIKEILSSEAGEGLRDYVTFERGIYSVEKEFWGKYEENLQAASYELETYKLTLENFKNQESIKEETSKGIKTSSINAEEQEIVLDTSKITGAIVAAAGAAVGTALASSTAIGALGGPIGAAIGAAVGTVIGGATAAAIASQGMDEEELIDAASFFEKQGVTLDEKSINVLEKKVAGETITSEEQMEYADVLAAADSYIATGHSLDSLIFTIKGTGEAFGEFSKKVAEFDFQQEMNSDEWIEAYLNEKFGEGNSVEKDKARRILDKSLTGEKSYEEYEEEFQDLTTAERKEYVAKALAAEYGEGFDKTAWEVDGKVILDGIEYNTWSDFQDRGAAFYADEKKTEQADRILHFPEGSLFSQVMGSDASDFGINVLKNGRAVKQELSEEAVATAYGMSAEEWGNLTEQGQEDYKQEAQNAGFSSFTIGDEEIVNIGDARSLYQDMLGISFDEEIAARLWEEGGDDLLKADTDDGTVAQIISSAYGSTGAGKLFTQMRDDEDNARYQNQEIAELLVNRADEIELVDIYSALDPEAANGKTFDEIIAEIQAMYPEQDFEGILEILKEQLTKELAEANLDSNSLNIYKDKTSPEDIDYMALAQADERISSSFTPEAVDNMVLEILDGNFSDKVKNSFLNLVAATDFTDADSIGWFVQQAQDLGINTGLFNESVYNATNALVDSFHAIEKLPDGIENTLLSLKGIIDQIRSEGKTNFTAEEYQKIVEVSPQLEGNFYQVGDSFQFMGTSTELANTLENDSVSKAIALSNQIAMGEKWQRASEVKRNNDSAYETNAELFAAWASDIENVDVKSLRDSLALKGVENVDELSDNEVRGQWLEGYHNWQNLQTNREQYNAMGGQYSMAPDAQTILNMGANTEEDEQLQTNALNAAIAAEEGLSIALQNTNKALEGNSSGIEENDKVVKAHVIDVNEAEKGFDNLSSSLRDNEKALKKSNKGTADYNKALAQVTNQAKELFGDNITEEFVEEHLADFQAMAKGDEAASERIRKSLETNLVGGMTDADAAVGYTAADIQSKLNGLDGLEFGVDGTADCTQIFSELAAVMGSADEAAAAMEALGYTVNWQPDGERTMEILDPNSPTGIRPVTIPNYKAVVTDGLGNSTNRNKRHGGGGGGGGAEKQVAKNPYERLHNLTQKTEELQRDRNSLEREYENLSSRAVTNAEELQKNLEKQLKNLQEQAKIQRKMLEERKKDLKNAKNYEYLSERDDEKVWTTFQDEANRLGIGDLDQYATLSEEGELRIDWDKIEAFEDDTEHGEDIIALIEEYYDYLETIKGDMEGYQDTLDEIEDATLEIVDAQLEARINYLESMTDLLRERDQQRIDEMQALSDAISDSNDRILEGIQESIDLERQIRDNTKTEEDIAEKEARLAYLRRDTSGANALEIKQLEEELADSRESYGDTLVDQHLDKLSKDNEKAQEQRDKQIELAQAQIDWWSESGYYTKLAEGLNESEAMELWKDMKNYTYASEEQKIQLMKEFNELWNQGGLSDSAQLAQADSLYKGDTYTVNGQGGFKYDSATGAWTNGTESYTADQMTDATYDIINNTIDFEVPEVEDNSDSVEEQAPVNPNPSATGKLFGLKDGRVYNNGEDEIRKLQQGINDLIADEKLPGVSKLNATGRYGSKTKAAVKAVQRLVGTEADGWWGPKTSRAFRSSNLKAYKTGGIADFTGPAWLDGTKSKPELILNAKDTQNFIMLKDVLSNVMSGLSSAGAAKSQNAGGDNYFDISIIVDEISSDYDVDKLAERVKQQINDDARYRNVNAINFIR